MTCKGKGARKFAPVTMEKSSPLTPKSQPRWGHYPILPSPITRGNAASTNTLTASSGSTSQKVPTSLFCPMPMSKGSRTNSTLAPERYSATKPLARFSSAPEICPLHFTVEWANQIRAFLLERGIAVRQGQRFLRRELPRIMATPPDVLSPRMVHVIEGLASDWRRLMSASKACPARSRSLPTGTLGANA